jgi:hypothetical protein
MPRFTQQKQSNHLMNKKQLFIARAPQKLKRVKEAIAQQYTLHLNNWTMVIVMHG